MRSTWRVLRVTSATEFAAEFAELATSNLPPGRDAVEKWSGVEALKGLGILARSPDWRLRMWVALYAGDVAGADAAELVRRLTADKHPDVRDAALQTLIVGGFASDDDIRSIALRKLSRKDAAETVSALWVLAAAGGSQTSNVIRTVVESADVHWLAPLGEVAAMLAAGQDQTILRGLLAHDHRRMRELATAAVLIHTPDAGGALSTAATSLPDKECRDWAKYAVDVLWEQEFYLRLARLRAGVLDRRERHRAD